MVISLYVLNALAKAEYMGTAYRIASKASWMKESMKAAGMNWDNWRQA